MSGLHSSRSLRSYLICHFLYLIVILHRQLDFNDAYKAASVVFIVCFLSVSSVFLLDFLIKLGTSFNFLAASFGYPQVVMVTNFTVIPYSVRRP